MKSNKNPKICELLGVEVGERFKSPFDGTDICINENGIPVFPDHIENKVPAWYIVAMINDSNCIIRCKKWTEHDIEDAKAIKRILPVFYDTVERTKDGIAMASVNNAWRVRLATNTFPSLKNGQKVRISEIIGDE